MTTSSRMEQSIRPDYHHHLQHPHHHQPIHSLHEASLPESNDEPTHRPLPPLAYLTSAAAAAACSPLLVSTSPTMGDAQEQPQHLPQPIRDREEHLFSRKNVESDHHRYDQGPTSSLGSGQFTHQPVPMPRFQVQSHLGDEQGNNRNSNSKEETSREYLSDKDRRSSEDRGLYAQQHQQQQRHQDQEAVHPFASSAEDSRRLTLLSKSTSSAYDSSSTVSECVPVDVEMKTTEAPSRRASMAMILDQRSPTPSPHDTHDHHDHLRQAGHYPYSQEHPHSQQRRSSLAFISSEQTSGYSAPRHLRESQYSSGSGPHPGSQLTPSTPSPPVPSSLSTDFHQRRTLPPIEPTHSLHSFMSSSRRCSVTDPELHAVANELRRRPSMGTLDTSGNGGEGGGGGGGHYNTNHGASPTSTTASSPSDSHYPSHGSHSPRHHPSHQQHASSAGPPFPPTATGPPSEQAIAAYLANRRESLPSIHSRAGPLGQLLAQEPQRRHSIANGLDPNSSSSSSSMGNGGSSALKRKTSGLLLTQVHTTSTLDYPAKRRDSIPDLHLTHTGGPGGGSGGGGHLHPSPPRRGSIASLPTTNGINSANGPNVPTLNLQPAAEIKSSSSSSSGQGPLDYARGQFPIHPMRRPSLFSESGLPTPPSHLPSRRASLADLRLSQQQQQQQQQPSPQQPFQRHPPGPSTSHDYDYHMGMDLEKMHLSSQGPEPPSHPSKPQGPGALGSHYPASHLYPGYGYDNGSTGFQGGVGNKGDTPYSRSPELRVSHKLAERKRRKEMKELFDELRDALPVDRSLKTSKWEILSKAVDYIASMKANQDGMAREIDMLRQELSRLKR